MTRRGWQLCLHRARWSLLFAWWIVVPLSPRLVPKAPRQPVSGSPTAVSRQNFVDGTHIRISDNVTCRKIVLSFTFFHPFQSIKPSLVSSQAVTAWGRAWRWPDHQPHPAASAGPRCPGDTACAFACMASAYGFSCLEYRLLCFLTQSSFIPSPSRVTGPRIPPWPPDPFQSVPSISVP